MITKTKIFKGAAHKVHKHKPPNRVKAAKNGKFGEKRKFQKKAWNPIKREATDQKDSTPVKDGTLVKKQKFQHKNRKPIKREATGQPADTPVKNSVKKRNFQHKNRKPMKKDTTDQQGDSTVKDGKFVKKHKFQHKKEDKKSIKIVATNETGYSVKKNFKRKFADRKEDDPSKKVKLFNLKKKDRKLVRKKKDHAPTFERGQRLKILWEQLRQDDCPPERKSLCLDESIKLITGHAKELSFAHDTVRVLECVFGLGTDEHKTVLFDELKEDMITMVKSKYGKHFWIKVLRHGSKSQKNNVMKEFHGKVTTLLCHTEAAAVVEVAFNECANATQRAELVQEFYGPSYRYFKESNCHSLKQLLEKFPEQKPTIIQHMKDAIVKLLKKSVVRHSIVHFVLYEFLTHADHNSAKEIIDSLRDVAVEILHTKEGSRAALYCLWHGSTKDRKAIIKSFKSHVTKIAKEEHGHMVLLAMFDCVDDTKLVGKHIISELVNNLSDILDNLYGRKVMVYLLTPRDSVLFPPHVIKILEEGDKNETSKKDPEIRRSELKKTVVAPLIQHIVDNVGKLYTNNSCCMTMLTILKHTDGMQLDAYKAIAGLVSQLYTPETKNTHIIESPGSTFMLKKLVADDKNSDKKVRFSEVLIQEAPADAMISWTLCNRGCFLLVSLLETEIPSVVKKVKETMYGHHNQLSKKAFRGAEILLKKLKQ